MEVDKITQTALAMKVIFKGDAIWIPLSLINDEDRDRYGDIITIDVEDWKYKRIISPFIY